MANTKYLINSVTKATTGKGKVYLRMQLFEAGGKSHKAVFWEDKDLKSGQIIEAWAEESEFGGEAQLTIKAARVVDDDPADLFLPRTPYSIEGLYDELKKYASEIANPKLKELAEGLVKDERWKRAPAAKMMHHAYLGGLLEHVVNLCRLSYKVAELYPKLRRDLLVTAAIIHDIGKMDEMSCAATIEYTTPGELLGHIVIGLLRVDKAMTILDFSPALKTTVRHLLISHHGAAAYGSPKSPQILEAQVFNNLDGIDANIGKITAGIEKAKADQEWTDKIEWNQKFFIGDVGL